MKNEISDPGKNTNDIPTLENTEDINRSPSLSDDDNILIEELLKNGVSLDRVCELFRNRIDEKCIMKLARNIISTTASAPLDENDNGSTGENNADPSSAAAARLESTIPRLGTQILNRSISAIHDSQFLKAHAINLAREAPEELLDPLFFTLMTDPVVVSSGYVFDRDTVLDEKGNLRISFCPFTRAPLKKDVYPLICRKRMLKDYQERTLGNMIESARRLLDEGCFFDFEELMSTAESFINDLGESIYTRLSGQLAKLRLEAHMTKDGCSSILPKDLAEICIRIYSGSPQLQNFFANKTEKDSAMANESSNNELSEFHLFECRIHEMVHKGNKAVEENEIDKASEWLDACEMVQQSCLSIQISTAKLGLRIAKAKDLKDLISFQRLVYEEIKSDAEEVRSFCAEEGISEEQLSKVLKPMALLIEKLRDDDDGDEWRCALTSNVLEYKVSSIRVHAGVFRDQFWGNAKGNIGLALYNAEGELVTRCNLFGTYRSAGYAYGHHPSRVLCMKDEIVSMARPGFKYALEYAVGGGGGHSLIVNAWYCKIFPLGSIPSEKFLKSYSLSDPEDDEGLYTGKVDQNGKAHGLGELVYYDRYIFVGKFSHGSLKDGVLYKEDSNPFYTMENGLWSSLCTSNIVEKYPYDVTLCRKGFHGGRDGQAEEENYSNSIGDGSYESDSDSYNEVEISFRNDHSSAVNIFWLDTDDDEETPLEEFNPIGPNESFEMITYHNRRFVAYNEDRSLRVYFVVSADENENNFVIESNSID